MKKIFLIGGRGQLGEYIQQHAPSLGYTIQITDREELDVRDSEKLKKTLILSKANILINTSAFHVVPLCEEQPENAFLVNTVAVYHMAKICKELGIQFITYTTDYVFSGEKGLPNNEDVPVQPVQVYGLSRAAGEIAARSIYPNGSYVIRTSALYGGKYGSPSKHGNFVLDRIKEARGKNFIEVSKEQIINPTYAADLSTATLGLIASPATAGIYHLINEGYCSWAEFAAEIFRIASIPTIVRPVDRSAEYSSFERPKFSALSNTKARKFGIILPTWQKGLRSYIAYLQSEKII